MERLLTSLALALLSLPLHAAEPQPAAASGFEQPAGDTVESLLALARERNPEIAAMGYEADAATARVEPAGSLPDPILRTELQDITNQGTDATPSVLPSRVGSTKYTLIQPIPFWGKRDLQRDAADAEAREARARADATWLDLAARIKEAYARYFEASQAEKLTQEMLSLTDTLEKLAQSRYASGLVPQQDVIRAQVEQTGFRGDLLEVESMRHHAETEINIILRRPAMQHLSEPRQLRPVPDPDKLDYPVLEQRLNARNPQLAIDAAGVEAASKNSELTYRNRYPDFSVGVSPIQTGMRVNEWELMIEFTIPLHQENRRSREREAQAMLAAAEARRDAAQNQVRTSLSENLYELETARSQEALLRVNLLPQAELNYQSAVAGYENGKVDFATVVDALKQIRKARLDQLKAQTQMQVKLAEVEKLLGEDL